MENQNASNEASTEENQKKLWMKWIDWLKSWFFVLIVAIGCVMWQHNIFGIATNETIRLIGRIVLQLCAPIGTVMFVSGLLGYLATKKVAGPDGEITGSKEWVWCSSYGLMLILCRFLFISMDNAIAFVTGIFQISGVCMVLLGMGSSIKTKKILKENVAHILGGLVLFFAPFLMCILGLW